MLFDVHTHPPRDKSLTGVWLDGLSRFDARALTSELASRTAGWELVPSVDHWREANEICAEIVRAHPDQLLGYVYVNPAHTAEALAEMERRLLGEPEVFVGLKLWQAVRCSDARLDPLMEFCAAHDVPVLQHTFANVGPTGAGSGNAPGESMPEDLRALAARHPRVRFIAAHFGGDWEWGAASYAHADNVWVDVSGGEALGGYMATALRYVGAGRILFATDSYGRSVPSQLAKVMGEPLPDADLERILWRNAVDAAGPRLPAAWRTHFS
ncbi:MAG TPA: amidohydrolase family protein [Chloroflexota bacterium]|nr:amidohydrolase family protein [Chloroflexota bacterium]